MAKTKITRPHYRAPKICKECGGHCCQIYKNVADGGSRPLDSWFDEWCEDWEAEFEHCGANKTKPLFDPLEVHMLGNEHMIEALLAKGIDPDYCKYRGKEGCIIPWKNRPNACKEYKCTKLSEEHRITTIIACECIAKAVV